MVAQAQKTDFRLRLPELIAYRAEAARRRALAFCDLEESVLGVPVLPMTPMRVSILIATGNRFVAGGQPQLEDIIDFIWVHSQAYSRTDVNGWEKRKRRAVRPLMNIIRQPWRRWLGLKPSVNLITASLALAITDIAAIVESSFADRVAAGVNTGPAAATLEAQFVHTMATSYGWTPERTRATPLKQLFQLSRCMLEAGGVDIRDPGEIEIIAAHLRRKNDALSKERKKEAVSS